MSYPISIHDGGVKAVVFRPGFGMGISTTEIPIRVPSKAPDDNFQEGVASMQRIQVMAMGRRPYKIASATDNHMHGGVPCIGSRPPLAANTAGSAIGPIDNNASGSISQLDGIAIFTFGKIHTPMHNGLFGRRRDRLFPLPTSSYHA
jgi:hypothetical protein